jgi:hypothetical protein
LLVTIIPVGNEQTISSTRTKSGDIYIESIEPIQVIEDADTLVTNKETVVRLVVQSTFTEEIDTDIEIIYDFGTKMYLETNFVVFAPGTNTIYVPGGPAYPGWPHTWNPHGFLKWTNTGFDSLLKAELDPDNELEEIDETNNEILNDPIRVANAPMVKVLYLPVAFPGDEDWKVSNEIYNQKKFMLKIYPLADTDLNFHAGPLWKFSERPTGTGSEFKNSFLELVAYPISCTARIMGFNRVCIFTDLWSSGSGTAIGFLRTPVIREPVVISKFLTNDDLVAHELGHTYYLWHPHDLGPAVFTAESYFVKRQEYGVTMDTFMSYRDDPTWIDKGRYDQNPKTQLLQGTYHYPGDPVIGILPKDVYLSVPTWSWNLMDQLTEDPPTYSCIMVHGLLRDDGTLTLNNSWYKIVAVPDTPQQVIGGTQNEEQYYILFINDNQQVISTFPFKASFNYVTHNDKTDELEDAVTKTVPFIFNIPELEGTRLIQIQNADGMVLAEREVTLNHPIVQVNHPNGGEEFKVGDIINIKWEGHDQDQDTLKYTLAFSNDSGENWIPMAFDIIETSFEWNTFDQNKGEYLIKVIASDGVNIGEDISDGSFTLPKSKQFIHYFPFLSWFFDRFPNLFPILRQVMGI